jgi:hypothetical protein
MSVNWQEKRHEPRRPASGPVRLSVGGGWQPQSVAGVLLDVSAHGFRAAHDYAGLSAGQEVGFEHGGRQGRARVAWTRVAEGKVESGFFVLNG